MIAAELGGGGAVDPGITDAAEAGLYRILRHQGVLPGDAPQRDQTRRIEIVSIDHSLFAPGEGVFDRRISAGQDVKAGDIAGTLHFVAEPRRASEVIRFNYDGFVLAHTQRGYVTRGDMLMLLVQDTS